jgi:hypothetical protein
VVGLLLIIQVPDAGDEWGVAAMFRPIDRLSLRREGAEHVVRMILHDIVFYVAAFWATFGTRFNINVRHAFSPLLNFCQRIASWGGEWGSAITWPRRV